MKISRFDNTDKYLLLFLFVSLCFLVHEVSFDKSIAKEGVTYYVGALKGEPIIKQHGGDMKYEYMEIELLGVAKPFRFKNCSFLNLASERAMKLKKGDSVNIGIIKTRELKYLEPVFFAEIYVKPMLKITSVSYCEQSQWKKALLLAIVLIVVIVVRVGKKYFYE